MREGVPEVTHVPGARTRARCEETGQPAVEAVTDGIGRFSIPDLPPCRYRVTVEFPGMQAAPVEVAVQAGGVAEIEIELKLASLREEITVSAQAEMLDTTQTAQRAALQESTIQNAPASNERVESLLPLLPGVVRGPDGLINMKGGRTSQGGMLLNSANVTDPVTGGSGMNLPIDVVSSAEVVANPYDPEYGKFTGAVASVDTRTSDFDKYHVRIQNFMPRTQIGRASCRERV
jgi:hypothetical protein